ncbi:MAG: iron ABC transporter permease [Planctomycetes bacterium]|nr:iron ABC transporter permease [Planctomycetota bacterium]
MLTIVLGFFLIWPVVIIFAMSFNTARDVLVGPAEWGLSNWRTAFDNSRVATALLNTLMIWALQFGISMPVSLVIAWLLGRTKIPASNFLELMFWVAYITPGAVIAWILLADPFIGYINILARTLPFIEESIVDIFSVAGIVWTSVMGNGIALKVMLLTPAFRNMDSALEEAARVSGASNFRTALRVTFPLMVAPIALVTALQMIRIFQSFETELLLGVPFGFFVYSTMIFDLVRLNEPPLYGEATVLASLTIVVVALIIPLQRWILHRRQYTTITGSFRPGLIDLGRWKWIAFGAIGMLHLTLTVIPVAALVMGSFMVRTGYFMIDPPFTLANWDFVFHDRSFLIGLRTTLTIALTTAFVSPILFSIIAYLLVRTQARGRILLDSVIWVSAAIPGMLTGLGLLMVFLGTPGLSIIYATIWALIIVVVLQGNTTGVNITKAAFVQVGFDMEDAARVAGAGWVGTYIRIWLPLILPTLALLATMNFVIAANTTASIILLSSRGTVTLSILVLSYAGPGTGLREAASVVSIVIMAMTLGVALVARRFGLRLGVQQLYSGRDQAAKPIGKAAATSDEREG